MSFEKQTNQEYEPQETTEEKIYRLQIGRWGLFFVSIGCLVILSWIFVLGIFVGQGAIPQLKAVDYIRVAVQEAKMLHTQTKKTAKDQVPTEAQKPALTFYETLTLAKPKQATILPEAEAKDALGLIKKRDLATEIKAIAAAAKKDQPDRDRTGAAPGPKEEATKKTAELAQPMKKPFVHTSEAKPTQAKSSPESKPKEDKPKKTSDRYSEVMKLAAGLRETKQIPEKPKPESIPKESKLKKDTDKFSEIRRIAASLRDSGRATEATPDPPAYDAKAKLAALNKDKRTQEAALKDKMDRKTAYEKPATAKGGATAEKSGHPPGGDHSYYSIQMLSYRDYDQAREAVERLKKKGYDAHIYQVSVPGQGNYFRVRSGRFPNIKDAEKQAAKIKKTEGLATFIYKGSD
ncbi:MAG: SPOR domain-containing protein [Deltaproteobacteria bacterium]|nr:SPOR domain-containing protein [Deltaproteobacteria bacterium]